MRSARTAVAALTTAFLAWPFAQAMAGPPEAEAAAAASAAMPADQAAPTEQATTTVRGNLFGATAKAVATDKLDGIRGGAEVVVSDMRLHGTVADNAAINVLSGGNSIADGSFSNASGIPTVIQNTGSNVLIQNATILNVQFKP